MAGNFIPVWLSDLRLVCCLVKMIIIDGGAVINFLLVHPQEHKVHDGRRWELRMLRNGYSF